jgi:hypothetical protein
VENYRLLRRHRSGTQDVQFKKYTNLAWIVFHGHILMHFSVNVLSRPQFHLRVIPLLSEGLVHTCLDLLLWNTTTLKKLKQN